MNFPLAWQFACAGQDRDMEATTMKFIRVEYALAACVSPIYRRLTSTDRNVPLSVSMEQEKVNNCAPFPRFARAVPTTESLRPVRLSTLVDSNDTDR
jgi:hypothetical protein